MTTTIQIAMLLTRIKARLIESPIFLRQSGTPADDPAHFRELAELESISRQLEIIVRDVRTQQHLLDVRQKALWNIPRDKRFPAAASIGQQQAEVAALMRDARKIEELIKTLMQNSGLLGPAETMQGASELLGKLYEQWHHSGHADAPGAPAYVPMPGQFQGSPEAAILLAFVGVRALLYVLRRKKK